MEKRNIKTYEELVGFGGSKEEDWNTPARDKPIIHIVSNEDGDWYGLYINGNLECEGHRLSHRDIFDALGYKFDSIELKNYQFEEFGDRCPKDISEVLEIKKAHKRIISSEDPYGEEIWEK